MLEAGVEGEDHARGQTDDQENRENRENRGQIFSTLMIAILAPFSIRVRCLADVVGGEIAKNARSRCEFGEPKLDFFWLGLRWGTPGHSSGEPVCRLCNPITYRPVVLQAIGPLVRSRPTPPKHQFIAILLINQGLRVLLQTQGWLYN